MFNKNSSKIIDLLQNCKLYKQAGAELCDTKDFLNIPSIEQRLHEKDKVIVLIGNG